MSRSKDKGTLAESALAGYLQVNGWPYAERRALAGAADRGDITGTPGVVWEVKYAGAGLRMAEWVQETIVEQANARARHGVLVVKPKGLGIRRVSDWFAIMVASGFAKLMVDVTDYSVPEELYKPQVSTATHHYAADQVSAQLAAVAQNIEPGGVPTVLYRPRGQREHPGNWYQVTQVKHIVQLLRIGGYGEPWGDVAKSL